MKNIINFNIQLPSQCFEYMKEISFYDHNYYKLKPYGDWFYGELDILFQQYHECENCYSYELGKMIDGKFKASIYWTITQDIFE